MNNATNSSGPSTALRSDIQYFSGSLSTFSFPASFESAYTWTIYEVNSTTLNAIRQVDLSGNPTAHTTNLKLLANALTFGLFQVSFYFTATMTNPTDSVASQKSSTFVRISPTGLSIAAMPNGVTSNLIGLSQPVTLNPGAYSYDLDSLTNMSTLGYTFYCRKVNRTLSQVNYLNQTGVLDLATAKQSRVLSAYSCFNSTGLQKKQLNIYY